MIFLANCQILFSGKSKKNNINLLSAELAQRVVKVKNWLSYNVTIFIQTCQQLIQIQPCSSHALYLLGASQFARYENTPPGEEANKLLEDVKSSFQTCISLEGKPAAGDVPEALKSKKNILLAFS